MAKFKTFLAIFYIVSLCDCDSGPLVSLSQGELLGKYFKTRKGRIISGFSGIPYAKPPVGELRFKPPIVPESWNGILNATQPHTVCPQFNYYDKENPIIGNEDCLYLNVYTPWTPEGKFSNSSFPVLFYIHGGSFSIGSARYDWLGPDLLLDKDIVLVTINYRLGVLGFLSAGDCSLPGNNGLKDQVMALKWVKENIATFGGDPQKVTICGNSAGGSSVHLLTLSPMTKGLIRSAIIQSGTAISPISIVNRNESTKYAYQFGQRFNCTMDTSEKLRKCLLDIDPYDIVRGQLKFSTWDPSAIPFKPTIEENCNNAFLDRNPSELIQSNDVVDIPVMIGMVPYEGIIFSAELSSEEIAEMEVNFNGQVFHDFNLASLDEAKKLRKFYFSNLTIGIGTKLEITHLYTDGWCLSGTDYVIRNHLLQRNQPLYFYFFDYRGSESYASLYNDSSFIDGPCHTDELIYLLTRDIAFPHYSPTSSDNSMTDIMTNLWFNFVQAGNPTPQYNSDIPRWEPVSSNSLEYYHIKGPWELGMNSNLLASRVNLWRNVSFNIE